MVGKEDRVYPTSREKPKILESFLSDSLYPGTDMAPVHYKPTP